jgi:hypothetical protein
VTPSEVDRAISYLDRYSNVPETDILIRRIEYLEAGLDYIADDLSAARWLVEVIAEMKAGTWRPPNV